MITRNFNLYLNAGHSVPLVINANQAEEGEQWVFSLFQEDGTPYTPTDGSIVGIKSDGYLISNSGTVVDGKVVINETQQMTAAAGKAVFELRIDGLTHGTANFIVLVEEDPTNEGIVSDSDLSLIEEALSAVSPLPTGGSVGQVLTKTANGSAWSDAGTPTQAQVAEAVSDWADENITVTTGVVIDTSLSVAGAAADAKKTGDEITDLKSAISNAIPYAVKLAMDTLFQNVAFKDDNEYRDELNVFHAWATAVNLLSISAVYTQSGTVYTTDTLDSLKSDLVVTANYDNGTSTTVTGYTLSGELTEGQSTVTVTYEGKTTTFNVTVSVRNVSVENGAVALADGTESENNTRARTDYIPVTNRTFIIDADINTSNTVSYGARYYDANYQYIGGSDSQNTVPKSSGSGGQYILDGWMAGDGTAYTDQTTLQGTAAYVRFLMRTTSGSDTVTSVSGTITVDGVEYEIAYE